MAGGVIVPNMTINESGAAYFVSFYPIPFLAPYKSIEGEGGFSSLFSPLLINLSQVKG